VCVPVLACVCVRMYVFVCVRVRERERERKKKRKKEGRGRRGENERRATNNSFRSRQAEQNVGMSLEEKDRLFLPISKKVVSATSKLVKYVQQRL
jgi:hypothetical protein